MSRYNYLFCILAIAGLGLSACKSAPETTDRQEEVAVTDESKTTPTDATDATDATETDATAGSEAEERSLPGEVSPEAIFSDEPDWKTLAEAYEPNADAVATIAAADDAEIVVYLGTWCGDSRREVSRWLGAVDEIEGGPTIRYIALDRSMANVETPDTLTNVPTFYVMRDGEELGRVVETAVKPIEVDVADILAGRRSGFISASVEPPTE